MTQTSQRPSALSGPKSVAFVLIGLLALFLRVWDLDRRPMHHDEANQAVRTGILLETGVYRYDPEDHHGPSLYYLSLPLVRLAAGRDFSATNEVVFRMLPALFGVAMIPLLLGLRGALSFGALALAALFIAVSPAMVFYSRFYIQEMLLVFFMLAAIVSGWRYLVRPSTGRAVLTGAFIGLMFATKETSVLAYTAAAVALLVVGLSDRSAARELLSRIKWRHLGWALLAGFGIASLLFTSFLTHPSGLVDVVKSFEIYLSRGLGNSLHIHPWYFYLKPLFHQHEGRGPHWTETTILILALIGIALAIRRPDPAAGNPHFVRFLAVYTVVLTLLYALIPHKTPWNLLPFLAAMTLLAGFAAAALLNRVRGAWVRTLIGALLAVGITHLTWLSVQANFRYFADPVNPYVYSHTTADFLNLIDRIEQIAAVSPEGRAMLIEVVADPYSMWPLPWYLRRFPNVGYWEDPRQVPKDPVPAVLITTPELEPELSERLASGFQGEFYGLRPSVLLLTYIRADLWESFIETRTTVRQGQDGVL